MSSPTHLVFILILTILFLSLISPPMVSADKKLVEQVCNAPAIQDHAKCLKTLSDAKAFSAKNTIELVDFVVTEGAEKGTQVLNFVEEMMKKPTSPSTLIALKTCSEVYSYCIKEFQLVILELKEDPMTANYDIFLIPPEVDRCVDAFEGCQFFKSRTCGRE